ncbi:MAG TPA: hypothetical protein VMZ53_15635, partial [Kofleriaceae bacterium]|nr:hypothetical protein [Kofleriaceae bacterium]
MSSSDGDDPTKKEPDAGATMAGGFAPPRPGKTVPPPRSVPGAAPYRPSSPATPYQPPAQTPAGHPQQPIASPQQPAASPQQPVAPQQPPAPYPLSQTPQPHQVPQQPDAPSPFAADPSLGKPSHSSAGQWSPAQSSLPLPAQQVAVPEARLLESESSPIEQIAEVAQELPGRFMGFLKISAKRAFRLRIEPTEVLPDERDMLHQANPPVTETNLMAFLAWR